MGGSAGIRGITCTWAVRFVLLLSVGVTALVFMAPVSAASARPFATGVTVPDLEPVGQIGYDRIRQAGASYTRISMFWQLVAPATRPDQWKPDSPDDPNYNWSAYDLEIVQAVAAGLTPFIQITSAPKWAERCTSPEGAGTCNPDPVAFAAFAKAAARRYSGNFAGLPRVRYWSPWNEPNLRISFYPQIKSQPQPAPLLYRTLLNRFAAAVKSVNRSNLVIAGGLAPLGGDDSFAPLSFARRLLCMRGRENPKPVPGCRGKATFDLWTMHPYTTGGPTHRSISPNDVQLGDLPEMIRLIRAARSAGKIVTSRSVIPFWITEFSWDSKPPDPGGTPMKVLTEWTAHAMFRSWRAGVSNFFWFTIRDTRRTPGYPFSWTLESGLYFRGETIEQDRAKANLRVFRFPFVGFPRRGGLYVWGRVPSSTAGTVSIFFRDGSRRGVRKLGQVKAKRSGVFSGFIRIRRSLARSGRVMAMAEGRKSAAFPLRLTGDYYQPPFG